MFMKTAIAAACLSLIAGTSLATPPSGAPAALQRYGAAAETHQEVEDLANRGEPPMLGIHWSRDVHAANQARSRTGAMTYHGGKILGAAHTQAIFWGTSWDSYSGDKITGMDSFYTGFGGSNYANTTTEYTDAAGTHVSPNSNYLGHLVDTSAASGGSRTSTILAEVCKMITSPAADGNGYYAVYTDVPRGTAGYCAWHSAGTCGSVPVQFAFFFKLDGDAGCDPQDTTTTHSQGLAALANVSGHELAEAMTDPASPGAWYDGSGAENGDKCAWTFGAPTVTFLNGSIWKLQGEWSNAAFSALTGYPNSSGQRGCLSGS